MSTVKGQCRKLEKKAVSWEEITLQAVVGLPEKSVQHLFHKLYYNVQ